MSKMTLDEIAYLARRDYDAVAGRTVSVTAVEAIFGTMDGRMTVALDPPAQVRIVPYALRRIVQDVETRWMDDELAPVYVAEVAEPHSSLVDVSMMWVHGTRYGLDGKATPGGIAAPIHQPDTPAPSESEAAMVTPVASPETREHVTQAPVPVQEAAEAPKVNTSSPWYRPA